MTTEERLEKMEIELKRAMRHNRILLVGVLLGVVLLLLGATTPGTDGRENVIKAKGFILVDEKGNERAKLSMDDNSPGLCLRDENGKPRIGLAVDKNGPKLNLFDENSKPRIALAAIKDGPSLFLADENGKPRASLSADEDGPRLALYDANNQTRANLGIGRTTTPDGKTITYPESSLILFKPDGKVIWIAPP
jgi:hypothetical protein